MGTLLWFFFVSSTFFIDECVVLAAKFPPGIELCSKSNTHCIEASISKALKQFKDGVPELGIPKLEPFEIPKLEIMGEPGNSVSLTQKYTNLLTYGIYTSEVYNGKFKISKDECYWEFIALTPNVRSEANYELNGQVLVFPINGKGKCNITLTNLRNHHQVWCELYEKNGKTYVRHTKYTMDMQPEGIHFVFENLFPSNKQISEEIHKTINENAHMIFNEVKHGFETVWSQLHLQVENNVFAKFSTDVLFPE